jgi:predicted DNA-binding transcriptional regulator AlpA
MSEILTTRELALRWRVSEHHIKMMRANNNGPAWVRVGDRAVRYRMADVLHWEESQTVRATVLQAAAEYSERAARQPD